MLDTNLKEQLKNLFQPLENIVELVYEQSSHSDHKELEEMLEEVASTSPKIKVRQSSNSSSSLAPSPEFHIELDGNRTGIVFKGIPGGHEFSSLILAILNADGKGKLPDENLQARIKRLKGPIKIKTYMSLTCENCPDVVQMLNQIALLHRDFTHEVIDGAYFQDEITALNIQGVPSIMIENKLMHSGRIQLLDLVTKLEENFGVDESVNIQPTTKDLGEFEVVVIGGGPAGASSAIYSARKGLKTAIITEKIGGQVSETKGIENLISVTYTEGPELAGQLYKHIQAYPIEVLDNRRVKSVEKNTFHKIELESGEYLKAQQIIITTGAKWRELGVPGEKEYMGRGVAYCPHCDGPYYKGKKVAVIGGGNSGVEAAIDLAGIVKEVILLEYNSELKADKILVDKLNSLPNVSVITNAKTQEIKGGNGDGAQITDGKESIEKIQKVTSIQYVDRATEKTIDLPLDGVFIQIGLVPNSHFLKDTVKLNKFGEILVDEKGRTSSQNIYAAGDVTTTPYKQIIIAMGEGAKVALAAFEDRMRS